MLWPVPEGHCFWRLNKIPVWGQTTFTDGHGLFPLRGTVSEASLAPADTCPSCWSQVSEGCTWVRNGRELPVPAEPRPFPAVVDDRSSFLPPGKHPAEVIPLCCCFGALPVLLFDFAITAGSCEVVLHCGLGLHFPDVGDTEHLFMAVC